ncbi:MAG: hypothetical protein ACFFEY_10515 [Candidatus Thorarchaeota archaeon]
MGQIKSEEKLDDMIGYYKKIRESLIGLYEIISINFNKKDFYHQAAVDNLEALHDSILEILKYSFNPREIRIKLRELEFDEKEAEQVFPL